MGRFAVICGRVLIYDYRKGGAREAAGHAPGGSARGERTRRMLNFVQYLHIWRVTMSSFCLLCSINATAWLN